MGTAANVTIPQNLKMRTVNGGVTVQITALKKEDYYSLIPGPIMDDEITKTTNLRTKQAPRTETPLGGKHEIGAMISS